VSPLAALERLPSVKGSFTTVSASSAELESTKEKNNPANSVDLRMQKFMAGSQNYA
jgi:hypothetical protein